MNTDIVRRDGLLTKARSICEKAHTEGRDLTGAENDQVRAALAEVKQINADRASADAKHHEVMNALDSMARDSTTHADGQHLALTGPHAKAMTERIIDAIPRDAVGQKALVTGGTSVVSQILLPQIITTGRPAVSVLEVLPTRVVPPSYSFLRQNTRTLAAAPVPAYSAKPVSDVGVVGVQNRLRVIATISSAIDHYLLADNTNLMSFVGDELVYGVRVAVENQVISGDGLGENMLGVLGTSGIIVQAFATDALTSVRKAITPLDGQGYRAEFDRVARERLGKDRIVKRLNGFHR